MLTTFNQILADAHEIWENRLYISQGDRLMSMKTHPRRKSLCRTRQDGRSQARYLKTVPRVGDENLIVNKPCVWIEMMIFKNSSPRRGRKLHPVWMYSCFCWYHLKTVPRVGDESTLDSIYKRGREFLLFENPIWLSVVYAAELSDF